MGRFKDKFFLALTCVCFFVGSALGGEEALSAERRTLKERLAHAGNLETVADYPAAKAVYLKATVDFTDYSEAWAAYGEHLRFYAHDEPAAIQAFQSAISAKQQDALAVAFAWRGLGAIECSNGRDEAALGFFEKSLKAYALADTHRSLCHLYCRQRKFKDAARHAGEALKLDPDDDIARLLYAAQLHRAGEPEKGRAEFQAASKSSGLQTQKPVHCCVLYNAAGYLSVAGENDSALRMLKRFFDTPNHRHLSREEIESDADFDGLKKLPNFKTLLDENFKSDAK